MNRGFLYVIISLVCQQLNAQYLTPPLKNDFKGIPDVRVRIYDSLLAQNKLDIAFTTLDLKLAMGLPITDPTSFQIISSIHTFPPKVFCLTQLAQNRAGENYILQDFRMHAGGLSSIYVNFSNPSGLNMEGYLVMKKDLHGRYLVVDSFLSNDVHSADAHSFVVDKNGYYWFLTYQYHKYDMSYRTHEAKDTGAAILTTKVEVWDPAKASYVFELDLWEKGLMNIDSIPMDIIELDTAHLTYDVCHANSWVPMGDDNGCPVGLLSDLMDGVKFIRLCDTTVLRYGASMPDFKPLDKADHHLYLQHDFKLITEGPLKGYFTCFSDGSGPNHTYRPAEVPVMKFDFKHKTVEMIKEFSFPGVYSKGRGNVDFSGDYMLVNFGIIQAKFAGVKANTDYKDNTPNWVIRNLKTDKLAAEYFLPAADHAYNAWFVKDVELKQPVVITKGDSLSIDAGKWLNPQWYDGETTYSIPEKKPGDYYVTVNGGSLFRLVDYDGKQLSK